MRAVVMRGHGGLEQLAVEELPPPAASGAHDVLVALHAAALNHLDLWTLRGLPGLALTFPHTLGADGAGTVEAVGPLVTTVRPGDRVMLNPGICCYRCDACLAGQHSLCPEYRLLGEHLPGTLAEYVVVPEFNVLPIPSLPDGHEPLSWAEAAAFSLVNLTAWRMLVERAKVKPGETVLIWGIGGGVSSAALAIAKLMDARVIATSSSDRKLEVAQSMGADVVLNHRTTDVAKEVRRMTAKRGVDVVVENVGEATWDQSMRVLGRGGRLIVCGATTGPKVTMDLRRLFWYQWDILGSTMGGASDYRAVVRALALGQLRPLIDSVFPFDRAFEAFRRFTEAGHMGKVVVLIR
jgi:NADPH:quinone reductase-like Zn-dependent oxidoreductase